MGPFESMLQEFKSSSLVERYGALLRAVESRAALFGAETRLTHLPRSYSEPFVLEYRQQESGKSGQLFVYRSDLELLTSEAISFLANRILASEGIEDSITILLEKHSFQTVQNVLRVTNLSAHAKISAYEKQNNSFKMEWELP